MDRDQGLRRTTVITGALIAASLAGTLGVGIAAYAADHAKPSTTTSSSAATSDSSSSSSSSTDSPSLSTGSSDSGQATSGGS